MIIDLHNKTLKEAKLIVNEEIDKAIKMNLSQIRIIYGYNSGNTLKNYFTNKKHYDPNKVLDIFEIPNNSGEAIINLKTKFK